MLAYKRKRSIINRSYQTVADDIVGIMTIASLDDEMRLQERVPKTLSDCQPGRRGTPLVQAPTLAAAPIAARGSGVRGAFGVGPTASTTLANKQLGGVVRIAIFFASNAQTDGFPLDREIGRARDCLAEHGVQLVVERGFGVVNFVERVLINPDAAGDNVNELRKRCEDLVPGQIGLLRMIVCRMGNFEFGHTLRDRSVGNQVFKPFAVLNTEQVDLSNATLIHEMVHCSKNGVVPHDPEKNSVFFEVGLSKPEPDPEKGRPAQTTLRAKHALSIASSFFSIGGPPRPANP